MLINTLLDVTRLQCGRMEYDENAFDIRGFISEVAEESQAAIQSHCIVTELNTNARVW